MMNGDMTGVQPYSFTGPHGMNDTLAQLRLDTEQLLARIELFLRGKDVQIAEGPNGEPVEKIVVIGKPKMNDVGIQSVMWTLNSLLTPQIVQGNIEKSEHPLVVYDIGVDLSCNIMENLQNWGIDVYDYDLIIDTIVSQLRLFLTRLIENKERESYVPTMQHVERYTPDKGEQQGGGIIGGIKGIMTGGR